MCGIAGFWIKDPSTVSAARMQVVADHIRHRGPDDEGYLTWSALHSVKKFQNTENIIPGNVGLIHRRLAILDLSKQGWQPMSSETDDYHIVFNGEIYNFVELKEELEKAGQQFHSQSDTEVLLKSYIVWGEACVLKFVGMFAFCILDLKKQALFCARDHFGIKPFYYAYNEQGFYFASEIKALLRFFDDSPKLNAQLAYNFLALARQERDGETFFKDIYEIPPASYFYFSLHEPKVPKSHCYWKIDLTKKSSLSFNAAASRLKDLFLKSIRLHLRSDVPLASTLSGGIDSSSILMAMRHLMGENKEINTISFISDHAYLSEEYWIDIMNKQAKAYSHKITPSNEDLFKDLNALIYIQEQPVGSSSVFAQYQVCKMIKNLNYKVVLDGQGADELLAGYRSYLYTRMISLIRQKKFFTFLKFVYHMTRLPEMTKKFLVALRHYLPKRFIAILPKTNEPLTYMPDWLDKSWFESNSVKTLTNLLMPPSIESMKSELLETFARTNLPHLLKIQDKNTMAFSIEGRVPFLTKEIAEFVFSLPEEFIIDNKATTKAVFRQAMKDLVSPRILNRRDKLGFSTPEKEWLIDKKEWVESILTSETAKRIPFIKPEVMLTEWRQLLMNKTNFCYRFWRWINFIVWCEQFNIAFD